MCIVLLLAIWRSLEKLELKLLMIWAPRIKYSNKRTIAKLSLKNELYASLIWLWFRYGAILVSAFTLIAIFLQKHENYAWFA